MKIKRLKKIKINSYLFNITWDKKRYDAAFSYDDNTMMIGCGGLPSEVFMLICHEVMEICALEMHVRFRRTDCNTDYIFVYDHRQHDTMMNMFASVIEQFID